MALSLKAEQKELLKIFKIEEQYVIPAYQRPYSWEYDQCFQLYNDLTEACKANEDYFIGNIIIAKSEANKETLEVVDGQQRLTTLLLLIKTLSIFQPEMKVLNQILEQEDWEGSQKITRIKSDIFEAKDGIDLQSVLKYSKNDFEERFKQCTDKSENIDEKKCKNRFEINILYFYKWLLFNSIKDNYIKDFATFCLKKVYLLPIELTGPTQKEANEKALIIFETMNNRGMSLEDADIFKAELYKKAQAINEEKIFIESWVNIKSSCEKLNLKIDDLFRYYSHIVRGLKGITSSEKNLREFFLRETFSPFQLNKYKEILDDLSKIIEKIEFVNLQQRKDTESAKWLQLIESYTNQYPKFAVITYLFINDLSTDDSQFVDFLKSLVRYVYYQGSTTRIKFEIYTIIKQVCLKQKIDTYNMDLDLYDFNHLGRLKYGFALLAFYVDHETINDYYTDKLITLRDKSQLTGDWLNINLDEVTDSLGNFVVLDMPQKNISFNKKIDYYKSSDIYKSDRFFSSNLTYENFKNRDNHLKKNLVTFFKNSL